MHTIYPVAFLGHIHIDNTDKIEEALFKHIRALVKENDYVEFIVGRHGDFDRCVSSVIGHVRKRLDYDNCIHSLVLPYATAEYFNNRKRLENCYDCISVYDNLTFETSPEASIQFRNIEVVDSADLIICYIEKRNGSAYKAVKYAEAKGKEIINLFE